jgi:hypothetical protein
MSYLDERRKFIEAGRPLPEKKKHVINKVSPKRQKKLDELKAAGTDGEMDKFFDAMLKRCTGKCLFCQGKTTVASNGFWRDDNPKWSQEANDKKHEQDIERMKRASIAHLLPKRPVEKGGFPSVATHESNWIELCWSCHTSFDSGNITWLTIKDSHEWLVIREKLLEVLPLVAEEERKHKLYDRLIKLVYQTP